MKIQSLLGQQSLLQFKNKLVCLMDKEKMVKNSNIINRQDERNIGRNRLRKTFYRDLRNTEEFKTQLTLAEKDLNHIVTTHSRIGQDIQKLTTNIFEIKSRKVKYEAFMNLNRSVNVIDTNVEDYQNMKEPKLLIADPPWNHLHQNPTREVYLKYDTMTFNKIMKCLKRFNAGIVLTWVVNKFMWQTMALYDEWNYELVNMIDVMKETKNGKVMKCHGYYLQHSKDTLCVLKRRDVSNENVMKLQEQV